VSNLELRAATDDAGNSLAPESGDPRARIVSYSGGRAGQQIEVPLRYPDNPGKQIATLRGSLQVSVGQDIRRFQIDNLMGAMKVTHLITGPGIDVQANKLGDSNYVVTVTIKRGNLPPEPWQAMQAQVSRIVLEDADGNTIPAEGWSGGGSDGEFKFTGHYSRMVFPARFGQPLGPRRLGEPTRLVWDVPTKVKTVDVDVEFHDLPMP
jgi:hypothetical protein